jgi:NADH-ubiquinone oxidoreductase chain 2
VLLIQCLLFWSLALSTFIALSASIPLYAWAALEVNTIAFIPIMLDPSKPERIRAAIKYFFIQAYASLIFLVGPLLWHMPEITIFLAMVVKLGISPFHNWYPSVVSNLNWPSAFLISTWQKVTPLWVIRENMVNTHLVAPLAALNAMVGGVGGLIQTEIRPLLAFSSIGHIGWVIFRIPLSPLVIFIYFISYTLHLRILIYLFYVNKTNTPKDISSSNLIPGQVKIAVAFTLLSLGGIPPLLGFIPKFIVLLVRAPLFLPPLFLMLGRYINIYYYISIIWVSFIASPQPALPSLASKGVATLVLFAISRLALILICGLNIHL